jgi:hypothetical protein
MVPAGSCWAESVECGCGANKAGEYIGRFWEGKKRIA